MVKLLFKDAIKTPWKLLALCLVVYLAATSLIVAIFLAFLGYAWVRKAIQQQAKTLAAAEAEAARAESAPPVVPVAPAVATGVAAAPAAPADAPQPAPKRQYAKSAVVIPLKTGTRD
ncbi:hypothetical protein LFL96_34670 (plasmid) [Paraburkholderia sp. D15]|uniref:hypothetical protein n=1 Tax=Paraburkholderia sp. D15 TaxID=2880218 RepID=UPI00247AFEE6|nr:hypothetical protein [Paraburkholderia sp. D15]WGS55097.1 hypothetical protein LFL96_34670 [Paraburkholderia sp. D15]